MPIGSYINADQNEELANKFLERAKALFTEGEEHHCTVVQQKPLVNFLPHSIIVTNKRIFRQMPGIFGAKFQDYLWQDMIEVHLKEKMLGVELNFEFDKGSFILDKLPKNQAKKIYSIAQKKEEEWLEKRRLRTIEMEQAKSGATQLNVNSNASDGGDLKIKLLEIKNLCNEGLITQDEYQYKKNEILKRI